MPYSFASGEVYGSWLNELPSHELVLLYKEPAFLVSFSLSVSKRIDHYPSVSQRLKLKLNPASQPASELANELAFSASNADESHLGQIYTMKFLYQKAATELGASNEPADWLASRVAG